MDLSGTKSFFLKALRVFILSLRGLNEDKCQLRASALSLFSLLSIVPVAAMIFGIAKGFGFDKILEKQILERLEGQEEVAGRIIDFSRRLLEDVGGGMIACMGLIILLWTIFQVLSNIENSFNDIWGIKRPRSLGKKTTDYLALLILCPLLLVASSTATVLIASQIEFVAHTLPTTFAPAIVILLKLLPYCVIWILLSFIYVFMPNTKVKLGSGILAGILAGTCYQLFQWGFISLQIGVARYNAIYGSFSALPLFLIWLQLSWLIVLLGAEISFALQNVDTYEFEPDSRRMSYSFRRLLILRVVNLVVRRFVEGTDPLDAMQLSHTLGVPIHFAGEALDELVESGILSEIRLNDERAIAYQPGRDTDVMTIKYVMDALETHGIDDIPVAGSEELEKISECLAAFGNLVEGSPANMRLKDISGDS